MTGSIVDDNVSPLDPVVLESESVVFEREVLGELVQLHLQVLKRSMLLVQLLLVLGIALLVFRTVEARVLLGWGMLTVAMECLRSAYARVISKRGDNLEPNSVHHRLILLAAIVGATIGLGAVLFMPSMLLSHQALLGLILFAMPMAGVSVSSQAILAAYSLFILAPASFTWATLYPHQTYPVVGLTALYWLFIISVAADGEQLLRRSVTICQERTRVIQDLETRNVEEHAAAAKAEQLARSRGRILASASHDLRQPLHALSVYSAVLASNPAPDTLPEVARNIDRLVRSLGDLLHGLLDLSRLSADYYVPERQRISLDRLVDNICTEYEAKAENKHIRLIRKLEHVRLFDDPVAIARITRNLLDNAFKYTDHGHVLIRTRIKGNLGVLIVEDTGKGIPLNEQNRIFEEFYQLDRHERDQGVGVGLGLAIIQRLCELTGAQISLVSKPGVGSKFSVFFDSVGSGSLYDRGVKPTNSKYLQDKRIYVLDDEIDILDGMRALLNGWGVKVKTVNSPKAADALFKQSGIPDLFIVDLWLDGEIHGLELTRRLQHSYGNFPVLVVTGETEFGSFGSIDTAGHTLLHKPINAEVLYEAANKALNPDNYFSKSVQGLDILASNEVTTRLTIPPNYADDDQQDPLSIICQACNNSCYVKD